jgi:hypothetical protein
MSCADKIKDKTSIGDNSQTEKNRSEMEACVGQCGDDLLKTLPAFTKKMREWFTKGYYKQ